jgi:hypothetical protein
MLFAVDLCAAATAFAQGTTVNAEEAKSLVRVVLRHEHIRLSPRFCELQQIDKIDKQDKPFVPDYYSFSASCDYPNTAATTPFGIYVVSPRTGDVFEFNRCEWFHFAELRRLQRSITQRTKRTSAEEANYRNATGCVPGRDNE